MEKMGQAVCGAKAAVFGNSGKGNGRLMQFALDEFEEGRVPVIANVAMLTEGFDQPDAMSISRP